MTRLNVKAIRTQVRALNFVRGTAAEMAMWREDDADSRANLAIRGMALDPQDEALFDMLRDEAVPPPLATSIILKLPGHAIRNLARPARQNPIWAVTALTLSPIALVRHLFRVAILFLIVGIVLTGGMQFVLHSLLGLARDSHIYHIVMMLTFLVIILVTLRALFQPLILRYAGPAHLLTIAPTRTSKGVGTIISNLLDYPGPVVCIDPKGDNARITARHRARFGPVHVLDPFGVTGLPSAVFNPLDRIDPDGLDLADDSMTLADALVYDAPGEAGEAHWNEEAKALISGLILSIVTSEPASTRTRWALGFSGAV